ncbi:amblin-like [Drosophila nasuta]|uniref:amblin-like n=1 Tax=Drosophila nasuta TaxID=42062 RepID=UPI00295F18A5|nr:amblin-like [Drosophila nasuta]
MKVVGILIFLALYVSHIESEKKDCRGAAFGQVCEGLKNRGVAGWPVCRKNSNNEMWYFDTKTKTCKKLAYRGCGGNRNRFCSRSACIKQCKQPIDKIMHTNPLD